MRLVSRCLLRAPLLPLSSRELLAHPLGRTALAIASPDLAAAVARGGKPPALARYGRRASFRPTPVGLLAGVTTAELGARTRIDTGAPEARLAPSWAWLARRGRELLDDPALRETARLRRTPSLLVSGSAAIWLHDGHELSAEIDARLHAILEACADWRPWPEVRERMDEDGDDFLLVLVDDGLLLHDLEPPLVGPAPLPWLLDRLGGTAAAEALRADAAALDPGPDMHAVLEHRPPRPAIVSRAVVERAAGLAGLLFRLQEALAPPAAERALDPALGEALDAVTETFGPGAFPLAPLALGDFGTGLSTGDEPPVPEAGVLPAPLLAALVAGEREVDLPFEELDAALPSGGEPETFEIFLSPAAGSTPWLLGVHAPAGASVGRFAGTIEGARAMLEELADLEPPGAVDLAWAPEPGLADLCAHPPCRSAALALTSWPEGPALAAGELALVADERAAEPLQLVAGGRGVVRPAPLHRVRSTTIAPGPFRLLAGWSLRRQHAPWAMPLGPLAALPFVPRVLVSGFVISPATWRLPALPDRRALGAFRRAAGLPRHVQVGREDELLLVDLDARDALDELAGHERVWEVWPPLDRLVDRAGRRVELVALAVGDAAAPAAPAVQRVPPPRERRSLGRWRTFKLFGAVERQDSLLLRVVGPVVDAARQAGELDRWSFLRYVDGPGRRDHIRLRVHGQPARVENRLRVALTAARAVGDLTAFETADYLRELGRYGEAAELVERVAESDSRLVLGLLAATATGDAPEQDIADFLVRAHDTTCAALGLDAGERRALARRRRDAHAGDLDPDAAAAEFRRRQAGLRALLGGARSDSASGLFAAHAARLAGLAVPPGLVPELLHLASVRLAGPDPTVEALAYVLWERTLEGLTRRPSPPRSSPP